ncbi:hypothetical protein [Cytobacillus praedii]|uniref:hypothetical protein n=1 Tax=Cytobacillus praedii TaxID=1742358 RepID=UPI002E1C63FC|nr:hypothetical protein [Cytobacillus praedii]
MSELNPNEKLTNKWLSPALTILFCLTVIILVFGTLFPIFSFPKVVAPAAMIPCLIAIMLLLIFNKKE